MAAPPPALRPAPILTDDNHEYWEAASVGQLVAQRCAACGRFRHPPRPVCPSCHALEHDLVELAGTGIVYSFSVLHHPRHPAFEYPLVVALIDLDEGVRVLSNLVGVGPAEVVIGMPVEVRFEPTADDLAVPVFVPRGHAS